MPPAVLLIGFDPSRTPGIDAAAMAPAFEAGRSRALELGVDLVECLVPPDDTAAPAIGRALVSRRWAVVVIGGGLRKPDPAAPLLELAVEAVRRLAPQAAIAFNASPADTADAALRALTLLGEIDDALSAF